MKLCVLAVLAFATFAVALNAVNIKYLPTPDSQITVIPGSSEEFGRTLGAYANADSMSELASIRPYSVIVTNNSRADVITVVILLELEKPDGSTITHDMAFVGKETLLAPGESALMTPITGLNIRLRDILPHPNAAGSSKRQLAADDPHEAQYLAGRIAEYEAVKQVTVSIDSVAFADGSVVGPDKIHFIERSNKEREGERTVLAGAAERSPQERLAYLTEILNAPEIPTDLRNTDYFQDQMRRDTARQLINLINSAPQVISTLPAFGTSAEEFVTNTLQRMLSHQMPILFKETTK